MNRERKIQFINAGAGAGKTTELVTLFCEHLLGRKISRKDSHVIDGTTVPSVPADQILLTTFTRAAAAEFKSRIQETLIANGRTDLLPSVDSAVIGTLDSICQQYIQKYWYLLGMSPDLVLKEKEDVELILRGLLNDEAIVTPEEHTVFNDYVRELDVRDFEGNSNKKNYDFWREYVINLVDQIETHSFNEQDIASFKRISIENLEEILDVAPSYEQFRLSAERLKAEFSETPKGLSFYEKHVEPCIAESNFPNFECLKNLLARYKDSKKSLYWQNIETDLFLNAAKLLLSQHLETCRICCESIFDVSTRLLRKYRSFKIFNNIITYSDLEVKFLELLDNQSVCEDLGNSLKYVMVDEFQDINPIQLKIYDKLSNIVEQSYWVGDPKQSIYGFRGSDSALVNEVINRFPNFPTAPDVDDNYISEEIEVDGTLLKSQKLPVSHRSFKVLVEKANEIFTHAFSVENLGLESKETLSKEQVTLIPWEKMEDLENKMKSKEFIHDMHVNSLKDTLSASPQSHKILYPHFAKSILSIIKNENHPLHFVADRKADCIRPVKYMDIAILTYKNSDCQAIAEELVKLGIPVSVEQSNLLDQIEVRLMLAFLKYIYGQDKSLAKAEINKLWGQMSLKDNLSNMKGSIPNNDIFSVLDQFADEKNTSICIVLRHLLAALDMNHFVSRWSFKENRRKNLNSLIRYAEQFTARNQETSIRDFIEYVENRKLTSDFDNSGNTVKVLTYHRAKGLEWKIVILDSLYQEWKDDFYKKDMFGIKLIPDVLNSSGSQKKFLSCIPPMKSMASYLRMVLPLSSSRIYHYLYSLKKAEIIRLLYVGFTRAENHVIIPSFDICPLVMLETLGVSYALPEKDSFADYFIGDDSSNCFDKVKALKPHLIDKGVDYKLLPSNTEKHPDTVNLKVVDVMPLSQRIDVSQLSEDVEETEKGTCIHNFLAVYRWNGQPKIAANHDWNLKKAERLLKNYSMDLTVKAEELVETADAIFTSFENLYGPQLSFEREVDMIHYLDDGRFVEGQIDLLVGLGEKESKKQYVIVDYKNVTKEPEDIEKHTQDYFSQLSYYRKGVLKAEPDSEVVAMYICYPTLGKMVKIR